MEATDSFSPCSAHTNGVYSLRQGYKLMFLWEPVARGVKEGRGVGEGRGVVVARGQLKYRCLTVGVIPFSHDLHLEQSPKARHSTLAQEIKADSNLMRKVNLPNFYETLI